MISLRFGRLLRRSLLHVGLFRLCFLRFRLLLRGLLLLDSIFFRCGLRLPAKPALLSFAHLRETSSFANGFTVYSIA